MNQKNKSLWKNIETLGIIGVFACLGGWSLYWSIFEPSPMSTFQRIFANICGPVFILCGVLSAWSEYRDRKTMGVLSGVVIVIALVGSMTLSPHWIKYNRESPNQLKISSSTDKTIYKPITKMNGDSIVFCFASIEAIREFHNAPDKKRTHTYLALERNNMAGKLKPNLKLKITEYVKGMPFVGVKSLHFQDRDSSLWVYRGSLEPIEQSLN